MTLVGRNAPVCCSPPSPSVPGGWYAKIEWASAAQLLLVRFDQCGHAVESKVVRRRSRRTRSRTPPRLSVPSVDPRRCEPEPVGGYVVMEQTLRGVQDVGLLEGEVLSQASKHILKISRAGLV